MAKNPKMAKSLKQHKTSIKEKWQINPKMAKSLKQHKTSIKDLQ
jgi:septal ring factor EnvC (AmiA/AmiB activator)